MVFKNIFLKLTLSYPTQISFHNFKDTWSLKGLIHARGVHFSGEQFNYLRHVDFILSIFA